MSINDQSSSGASNQSTSGDGENQQKEKDTVAYATYQKVLGEKKRTSEELATIRAELEQYKLKQQEAEEARLKEQGQFKEIAERERKARLDSENRYKELHSHLVNEAKKQALLKQLPGSVEDKFHTLLPVDKIAVDEEGNIDELTVQDAAKGFLAMFPETVKSQSGTTKIPHTAAKVNGKISYEEWLRLPLKEKRTRLADVIDKN